MRKLIYTNLASLDGFIEDPDVSLDWVRIDEYRLFIQPLILGPGKPMFPVLDRKLDLELLENRRFSSGVVYLHYRTAPA